MAEVYPHIVSIALDASDGDPSAIGQSCDEQLEFQFTLDLLLDAFEVGEFDGEGPSTGNAVTSSTGGLPDPLLLLEQFLSG